MLTDYLARLSGKSSETPIVQALTPTTAGVLSTDWMDLGVNPRWPGDGTPLLVQFGFTVAVDSATDSATLELQVVLLPLTSIATFVFVDADVSVANDTITEAGHGLTNGTRLTLTTSGALPTGLALATNYYVRDATTDTFKLSRTPGGTVVNITAAGGGGNHTVTWHPEVVGSSGPIGIDRLGAGALVPVAINPLQQTPYYPANRYLFARYVPSATITAGSVWADVIAGAPDGGFNQFPTSGYAIA